MNGGRPGRRPYDVIDSILMSRTGRNLAGKGHSQFQRCMITCRRVQIVPLITMLILAFGDELEYFVHDTRIPRSCDAGKRKYGLNTESERDCATDPRDKREYHGLLTSEISNRSLTTPLNFCQQPDVPLGGLHRSVTEKELNLFELSSGALGEPTMLYSRHISPI
jgi:hypothetical protein